MMEFGLDRFLEAQDNGGFGISYNDAIKKLKEGKFLTEGLWYIFPTLKEFGTSKNDKWFGLSSLYEAYEFWSIPQLRDRLKEAVIIISRNRMGRTAEEILGEEGARRFHSCITVFDAVYPEVMFDEANETYFAGRWDKKTANLFKEDWYDIHNDVWEIFNSKFLQRAYFDYASHEATNGHYGRGMRDEERFASFLHLSKYGYDIYRLTWNYLALRDWLGNKEREEYTRESILLTYNNLRNSLIKWMEENLLDSYLLKSLFTDMESEIYNKGCSWRKAAFMFDSLCRHGVSDPQLRIFIEETIHNHSLLSNVEYKCSDKE